jgi:hypothetical protein
VRGDVPGVPERVLEAAGAVAVALLVHRLVQLRADGDGPADEPVDVVDVEENPQWRAA